MCEKGRSELDYETEMLGARKIHSRLSVNDSEETAKISYNWCRVFSHDVTAAILVSQNNETAAMLVSQTNPLGVELFCYANAFFCSNKSA